MKTKCLAAVGDLLFDHWNIKYRFDLITVSWFESTIYRCFLLSGVSAVEAEWVPQLLPQYCHFSPPLETPAPRFCSSTGTIKCHRPSTFCMYSTVEKQELMGFVTKLVVISVSFSPCGLAAPCGGDGVSRRSGSLQAVCQVSTWGTGTAAKHVKLWIYLF